jgi:hypothetical protein
VPPPPTIAPAAPRANVPPARRGNPAVEPPSGIVAPLHQNLAIQPRVTLAPVSVPTLTGHQ